MAKRKMDKIKQFAGNKQAVRAATRDWMEGNVGAINARTTRKHPPAFQVAASTTITKKPKTTRASQAKPKQTKKATAVVVTPAITLSPVSPIAPHTPAASNVLTTKRAATGRQVTEELSDDESAVANVDNEDEERNLLSEGSDEDEDDVHLMDAVQAIITPRRQVPEQLPVDAEAEEEEMTVQQYQVVLADYQDRLLRAERQVRAISKTHLADKFMENEVRKYVKESLWKRCKFITSAETMELCMNAVANHFSVATEKREHWKSTYAHSVRDALNNRRNNTAQDLKKELVGKCLRQWWLLCTRLSVLSPMICV
jgi:predicted transposase YbfD/YdcC